MAHDQDPSVTPIASLDKEPTKKEDIVRLVDDEWHLLRRSRTALEFRIKEGTHMLGGDQWIRWLPYNARFDRHNLEEWVPTPVTNYLVRAYDRIKDLFTSGDILPTVDPATRAQRDIEAAKAAEKALRSEFYRLKTDLHIHEKAAGWLVLAGTCVLYSGWDPRAGVMNRVPRRSLKKKYLKRDGMSCSTCEYTMPTELAPERCPQCIDQPFLDPIEMDVYEDDGSKAYELEEVHDEKNGVPQYDEFKEGQLVESCVNLLNWYPQPARRWEDVRYVLETDPMDIDQVKDLFPKEAKDLKPEGMEYEDWTGADFTGAHSSMHVNGRTLENTEADKRDKDRILVKIFRHIPDHRFKKGLLAIVAGNKLLYKGPLDSCDGKLPYTLIKYRDMPGLFWGGSVFSDIIPQQKRINAIDSHLIQNRKQMVSNQWLIPNGAGISKVDGRAGLIIRYDPMATGGHQPQRLPGTPVSQQVVQERESAIRDLEQISGASDPMQGGMPPGASGIETGAGVELIQEQAFKRFGPAIRNWRMGLADHEHRKLQVIEKYWETPRLVKVLGEHQHTEASYFSKADVQGTADMIVRVAAGMDRSKVAHQQKIMRAAQMGLLGDIRQPNVRGKILEQLEVDGFEAEYVADAKKARRIIQAIVDGAPQEDQPPPLPFDNHQIQLEVFREYMLTTEFEALEPEQQQMLVQRAQMAQQQVQQQQQQAMMAAQAAKGAPEQAGNAVVQSGAMGAQGIEQQAPTGV